MVIFMGIDTENLDFIEEVKNLYEYGFYNSKLPRPSTLSTFSSNHIFNELKSVKWNCEKVIEENNKIEQAKKDFYEDESRLKQLFEEHFKIVLMKEYDFNKKQADIFYDYIYSEYRRSYRDMLNYYNKFGDVVSNMLKASY